MGRREVFREVYGFFRGDVFEMAALFFKFLILALGFGLISKYIFHSVPVAAVFGLLVSFLIRFLLYRLYLLRNYGQNWLGSMPSDGPEQKQAAHGAFLRFLGYSILLGGGTVALALASSALSPFAPLAVILIALPFMVRIAPVFPAVACGEFQRGIAFYWRATSGKTIAILTTYLLILAPLAGAFAVIANGGFAVTMLLPKLTPVLGGLGAVLGVIFGYYAWAATALVNAETYVSLDLDRVKASMAPSQP